MKLSVMALTAGHAYAERFLKAFRQLADDLEAEFVVAGDGIRGQAMAQQFADVVVPLELNGRTQENAIAPSVAMTRGDWILRFDDDESCSPAMREWLLSREWEKHDDKVYSFPYAWLWGDANHFITSYPFWPDPHARLMPRAMTAQWPVQSHGPNPFGTGIIVPVAHLHHKFLVRSFAERQATAKHYDTYFPGAGTGEHYGKFTLPELFAPRVTVREVGHGDVCLQEWMNTGEPTNLLKEAPLPERW